MKTLSLFILLIILPVAVYSQTTGKVIRDNVNIRTDSTVSSSLLGTLNKTEVVDVVEKKFEWYKIRLPKRFIFYVAIGYCKLNDDGTASVTTLSLNLRQEPSKDSLIIGKVTNGNKLYGISKIKDWLKVQGYPYVTGWVHQDCLEVKDEQSKPAKI